MNSKLEGKKLLILGANPETIPLVKRANEMGINTIVTSLRPSDKAKLHASKAYDVDGLDVEKLVELAIRDKVDGVLVQLPLPDHLDEAAIIAQIDPTKDVDGLTETSAGKLFLGKNGLRPCTPVGCVMLAENVLGDLSGKSCVIVGRSILVGKPAAMLFLEKNCTVTIAHSRTVDLAGLCRSADILIAAVGRPQMIKENWIKPGACVIDVGINRIDAPERGADKTRLVGDVDFERAAKVAGAITPVPGGVGPMTIACLLRNTLLASAMAQNVKLTDV